MPEEETEAWKMFGDQDQDVFGEEEEKQNESIEVYLTAQQKRKIKRKARDAGLSVSTYGRFILLGKEVTSRVDRDTRDEIQEAGALLKRLLREGEGNEEAIEDTLHALREAVQKI